MKTDLLKTILSALACALLVSGCERPITATPTSTNTPSNGGPISIRVEPAEPSKTIVKTEDFRLPNCGGTGPLRVSLGAQKRVGKGITIGDKATIGGSIEVDIPPAVKLKLEAAVEHAYQQTITEEETRLDTITMEANAGTNVVYMIEWEQQTYESNIDFVKETEALQTPYTFTLSVPKVTNSHQVGCFSTPQAVAPTASPTETPTPTSSPTPSSTATLPPFYFCQKKGMGGVETVPVNPPRSVKGILIDLETRHVFKNGEAYGFSLWEVEIYGPDTVGNLAIGATAFASSEQDTKDCIKCLATKAIDGNNNSRWGSEFYEPQWLQIDFSTPQLIRSLTLKWQDAYAEAYCITEIK